MDNYPEYSENDFRLYHHGILGMKWGDRNGPPYPLDASDHSASERKAGWKKSLAESKKSIAKERTDRLHELNDRYNKEFYDREAEYNKQRYLSENVNNKAKQKELKREYNAKNAETTNRLMSEINAINSDTKARLSEAKTQAKTQKEKEKQQKAVTKDIRKNWHKTHNAAANDFNSKIGSLNEKYKGSGGINNPKYMKEVSNLWKSCYEDAIKTRYGDVEVSRSMFPTYYTYDNM